MLLYIILAFLWIPVQCWETGNSYLFHYTGFMETGILETEIGNLMKILGYVNIQVAEADLLMVQLKDMESYNCNRNLTVCKSTERMENSPHPTLTIEEPFFINFNNKKVSGFIELNSTLNPFASFQKGIVSLLKSIPPLNPQIKLKIPDSYTVVEEEVTGVCANAYEVSQLPRDVVTSDSSLNLMAVEHCENDSVFLQIVKTRDFNRCTKVPIFNIFAPAGWRCNLTCASCETSYTRSLVQRTLACGNERKFAILQSHLVENIHSAAYGATYQQFYGRVSQNLKLIRQDRLKNPVSVPNHRFGSLQLSDFVWNRRVCDIDVVETVKIMANSAFSPQHLVKGTFHESYRTLQSCLRNLELQELRKITENVKEGSSGNGWSLYLDVLLSTGTSSSIRIFKDLLESWSLSKEDAVHLVSIIPAYLHSASSETLTNLLTILELPFVRKHRELRQTTFVAVAAIYRLACVDPKMKQIRFPVFVEQINCTAESGKGIPESFVMSLSRYLRHNSSNGDKMAALSAYNTIGHPSVLPFVIPIIEGKVDVNPSVRTKAVLTLHKLAHVRHTQAVRILYAVYANPSENYQVRLAAFTLLMLSNPTEALWQSVALATWFEPRTHVISFVYTTLETLATLQSPIAFMQNLSDKAKLVLELAKPPVRGPHLSANYIWSYVDFKHQLGSYLRIETFANKASLIPKDFYGRLNWNLGPLAFDFLEFDFHSHRLDVDLQKIFQKPVHRPVEQSQTLKRIFKLLKIKEHDRGPSEALVHWTLMESVEKFHTFDFSHLESLLQKLTNGAALYSRNNMDWYNLWPLVNVDVSLQNSMGFLTELKVDGKVLSTANGHWEILSQADGKRSVQAHLNPTNFMKLDSFIRIKSSTLQEIEIRTGLGVENFLTIPGFVSMEQSTAGNVTFSWTIPGNKENVPVYLHQICPYLQSDPDADPVWQCQNEMQGKTDTHWNEDFWRQLPSSLLGAAIFFWLPTWDNIGKFEITLDPSAGSKHLQVSTATGFSGERQLNVSFDDNLKRFDSFMNLWPNREAQGQVAIKYSTTNGSLEEFNACLVAMTVSLQQQDVNKEPFLAHKCLSNNQLLLQMVQHGTNSNLRYNVTLRLKHQDEIPGFLRDFMDYVQWTSQRIGLQDYLQQRDVDKNLVLTVTDNERPLGSLTVDVPLETELLGSANYSVQQQIFHLLMGGHYTAECRVDARGHVHTFDGLSYQASLLTGCKYLVLAATGDLPNFALFVQHTPFGKKVVELVLPADEIRVSVDDMTVTVNRMKIDLHHQSSFTLRTRCHGNQQTSCAQTLVQQVQPGILLIDSPREDVRITISKDHLQITARASLRGRVQGLCGDLNEESMFELRGPRRCVLSGGAVLSAAYALPDPSLDCYIPKDVKRQLQMEQQRCPKHEGFPTSLGFFTHHDHSIDEDF